VAAFLMTSDHVHSDKESFADSRAVFDHYCDYMKNISRGYPVSFERFKSMLRELGYRLRPYVDGVGVHREEVIGLDVHQAVLPGPR